MQVSLPLWATPSDLHAAPWPCDWDEEGSQRGRQPALGGACPGLTATPTPPLSPQVFSIVVFGSIVNEGYLNSPSESEEFCIYNRNPNACGYGVTVGVLAFLTCLLYLALDVYFPQISSVKDRKKAVLSDIGVSGEPHPSGYCAPLPPPASLPLPPSACSSPRRQTAPCLGGQGGRPGTLPGHWPALCASGQASHP